MSNPIINGLEFSDIQCRRLSSVPISLPVDPEMPLVSIEAVVDADNMYKVTIMANIPVSSILTKISPKPDDSFYLPIPQSISDELVCFVYDGNSEVPIGEKNLNCRWFRIDYDYVHMGDDNINYDEYLITFKYQLLTKTSSVDAIKVRVKNIDPELSRGTITTVRFD